MEENIITLIDEDGKEVEFEVCLTLEAEGKFTFFLMMGMYWECST